MGLAQRHGFRERERRRIEPLHQRRQDEQSEDRVHDAAQRIEERRRGEKEKDHALARAGAVRSRGEERTAYDAQKRGRSEHGGDAVRVEAARLEKERPEGQPNADGQRDRRIDERKPERQAEARAARVFRRRRERRGETHRMIGRGSNFKWMLPHLFEIRATSSMVRWIGSRRNALTSVRIRSTGERGHENMAFARRRQRLSCRGRTL